MLVDNPLLTTLGRRGRGAVVEALLRNPGRTWTVRDLARFADVLPMVASRTVREMAALGAVDIVRPGRDARIQYIPDSAAGRFLAHLEVPDLGQLAAASFAAAYRAPPGVTWVGRWIHPDDDPGAPSCPVRIAIVARNPEQALERAGAALDAVRSAGLPVPDVSAWTPEVLRGTDKVARAIVAGRSLALKRTG